MAALKASLASSVLFRAQSTHPARQVLIALTHKYLETSYVQPISPRYSTNKRCWQLVLSLQTVERTTINRADHNCHISIFLKLAKISLFTSQWQDSILYGERHVGSGLGMYGQSECRVWVSMCSPKSQLASA